MLDKRVLYFLAVVEEGSFSAAGKAYVITQSAISQQIAYLESELDVTLFDRSFYKPRLTKAGKTFYDFCTETLEKETTMLSDLREISRIEDRVLHIGITGPLEAVHLPNIIALYEEQYPEKIIKVTRTIFKSCVRQMLEGELDAVFGTIQDLESYAMIETTRMIEQQICLITSPNHPLGTQEAVSLKALADYPIITLSKKAYPDYYATLKHQIREEQIILNIVKYVDSMEELIRAVQLNQGIAWIGKEIIGHTDKVRVCPLAETYNSVPFGIGKRKRNQKTDIQDFIDLCQQYFNQLS
ncbi:LysR family transcriptional regulator [Marinilactibacillus kalidii]|uniref:LysR family transcriptional regulator n=1 Tax=Marinilactibacillus kalidii TaxID=2820274 RepID=UPI001ABE658D|nr:LysR family transcriptional regulator [Marinilactibacillus kalidii]